MAKTLARPAEAPVVSPMTAAAPACPPDTPFDTVSSLAGLAARILGADTGVVAVADPHGTDGLALRGIHGGEGCLGAAQTGLRRAMLGAFGADRPVAQGGVPSVLAVPLPGPGPTGVLAVEAASARMWSDAEIARLGDVARTVGHALDDRTRLDRMETERSALAMRHDHAVRYNALRESLAMAFMVPDMDVCGRFGELLRAGCRAFGMETGLIARVDGDAATILYTSAPDDGSGPYGVRPVMGSLAGRVLSGEGQIYLEDVHATDARNSHGLDGGLPRRYLGTPLVLGGVLFGVLEFTGRAPRRRPWTEEELAALSTSAMFACAHLGVVSQIRALRSSEAALLHRLVIAQEDRACAPAHAPARDMACPAS